MSRRLVTFLFVLAVSEFLTSTVMAKDRALLIGIDEYQSQYVSDIEGCENDTKLLKEFLTTKLGFKNDDIKVLINRQAAADDIRDYVRRWLIEDTQPGDRVFFAYAGHGARVPDTSGDEEQDSMDEVLAAYDVVPEMPIIRGRPAIPTSGYITDDEISQWVARLYGRQLVMLFDSCHSGTISRGVGKDGEHESRFLRFRAEKVGGGREDVYSPDYNKNPKYRDMFTATEGFLDGTVNGVVILSAAKAHQEAFPIYAHKYGRKQGALTYLFVEKQAGGLIAVESLQSVLGEGMEQLRQAGLLRRGRNGEYQIPQVEIYSHQQAALPIFGGVGASWTAAPVVALHNPLSKAQVEIWTADGRRRYSITKNLGAGRVGEMIPLVVRTSSPGYLYIWVFSRGQQGDMAKCLFPWREDKNNDVSAGTYSFPRCKGGKKGCAPDEMYEYFAADPEGQDLWVALITDKPLELQDTDYVYSWADAFQRIGLKKVQEAVSAYAVSATTRGGGVRPTQRPTVSDWQAGVLVLDAYK